MMTPDCQIQCPACTIAFMLPAETVRRRKEQKKELHCPACGGGIVWPTYETTVEEATRKMEAALTDVRAMRDSRDHWLQEAKCKQHKINSLRSLASRLRRQLDEAKGKRR